LKKHLLFHPIFFAFAITLLIFATVFPLHIGLSSYDTDFLDYCTSIVSFSEYGLQHPFKRSLLAGIVPYILSIPFGVINGIALSSILSFFVIALAMYFYIKDFLHNSKKLDASSRNNLAASLRIKLSSKINYIKFMANTLVILGLIGTVIGFIIALSGVDGSVSSNPEEVSKMVSTLIQGMSVALYTTLVGSICSVWLNICYQIMSTGANNLLSKIIELGEKK